MTQYYNLALKVAQRSNHPKHKLGAVVVKGGAIISKGYNVPEPVYASDDLFSSSKHAEERAIRKHENYEGSCLYIARSNNRVSKPCPTCMEVIREAGIANIVYKDHQGNLVRERIR